MKNAMPGNGMGKIRAVPAENRFADCVSIELDGEIDERGDIQLDFRAAFSEMWWWLVLKRFPYKEERWRFSFAIRRADLDLVLRNLRSPRKKRRLRKLLIDPEAKVRRSTSEERTEQTAETRGVDLSGKVSLKGVEIGPGFSHGRSRTRERKHAHSDEYELPAVTIESTGSDREPKWIFKTSAPDAVLKGEIETVLAALEIGARPASVTARLRTSYQGIQVVEVDSPRFEEERDKKQRVIHLAMREGIHRKCAEYLSKAEVHYER